MSGALFLSITTLVCAGLALTGIRLARAEENPWTGQRLFGMPVSGAEMSVGQVRRFGRIFLIAAPLFWLFIAAMCFGLLPAEGIQPILIPVQE